MRSCIYVRVETERERERWELRRLGKEEVDVLFHLGGRLSNILRSNNKSLESKPRKGANFFENIDKKVIIKVGR